MNVIMSAPTSHKAFSEIKEARSSLIFGVSLFSTAGFKETSSFSYSFIISSGFSPTAFA